MNRTRARRLAALERQREGRAIAPPSSQYWSPAHRMMMQNIASFALPAAASSSEEWEQLAVAMQGELLAGGGVPVDARDVRPPRTPRPPRPIPGARVAVIHRASGVRSDHPAVDARELCRTGEYEIAR